MEWIYKWFIFAIWRALESKYKKTGRKWMYFTLLTKIIRDLWLQYTIPGILKAFSRWWLQWGNIQEEEIIVRNWKKRNIKAKNFSKITTYIRWTRALSAISSRLNQSSASLRLRNYVLTKKLAIAASIYLNSMEWTMFSFPQS